MYNTVSLEVAKKLNKIGWKNVGIFVYDDEKEIDYIQAILCIKGEYMLKELRDIKRMHDDVIPAPQLHEILEVLPYKISIGAANLFFKMEIFEDDYRIGYYEFDEYPWGEQISENPHDAAALLWIWCVENNYITL